MKDSNQVNDTGYWLIAIIKEVTVLPNAGYKIKFSHQL